MNASTNLNLIFTLDHETKNTVVYKEQRQKGKDHAIGTLYLRKEYFESLNRPDELHVTVATQGN